MFRYFQNETYHLEKDVLLLLKLFTPNSHAVLTHPKINLFGDFALVESYLEAGSYRIMAQ